MTKHHYGKNLVKADITSVAWDCIISLYLVCRFHSFHLVRLLPHYHGDAVAVKEGAAFDNCRQ